MITWVLILFTHASVMSDHDSMAITSVSGFKTQQECTTAGGQAKQLTSGTVKELRFVCVSQTRQ